MPASSCSSTIPGLPDTYDMIVPAPSIEDYRKFAELRVEALNHALQGMPEDRMRYHICWGSWHGPHTHDLPLKHVVDLMLQGQGAGLLRRSRQRPPRARVEGLAGRQAARGQDPDPRRRQPRHQRRRASRARRRPHRPATPSVVGRENVIAGTDCGLGGRVHPQIGWAKLKALAEGAELASKELWGR